MADDPRVEPAARAAYDAVRPQMGFPTGWDEAPEPLRQTYRDIARTALAAADEVERLRAQVEAGITTERDSNATARRLLSEVRAERDAAKARYTALVEGVRGVVADLDESRASGHIWTYWQVQDRLRTLLSTTEEGVYIDPKGRVRGGFVFTDLPTTDTTPEWY